MSDYWDWEYLIRERELFARSYTQWALMRMPQWVHLIPAYSAEVRRSHGVADIAHWPGDDFDAIDAALTALLMDPQLVRERLTSEISPKAA